MNEHVAIDRIFEFDTISENNHAKRCGDHAREANARNDINPCEIAYSRYVEEINFIMI